MSDASVATLIVTLIIAVAIFLVCREVILWYFKLNAIVSRLDTMIQHLAAIERAATGAEVPTQPEVKPRPAAPIGDWLLHGSGKNSTRD